MKRRGFLGIIGGAAVAGPAAAKNIIKTRPDSIGSTLGILREGPSMGAIATAGNGIDRDWRLGEIERLRRFISGGESEEEKEAKRQQRLHAMEPIVSQNVMCLQSVSAATQVRMHRRRMDEIYREVEVIYSKRRLTEYLKEMGL